MNIVAYGYLWFPGVNETISGQVLGFTFTLNVKVSTETFCPAIDCVVPVKVTVGSELAFLEALIQQQEQVWSNMDIMIWNIVFSAYAVVQGWTNTTPAVSDDVYANIVGLYVLASANPMVVDV